MPTKIELAAQFINSTSSHIFLTGKAGTGKTTFLHNLARATHKNYLVVAPTGIAALNAKGVTIHSQFLLPFGTFLPVRSDFDNAPDGNFYTSHELARRHALNSKRKQVLRNIDLLVIDEVSMLRADILDALDYRLKAAKGDFHRSFGGVQLLMIGDLFQLPPIVKDHEWKHLQHHYPSIHFFQSQALRTDGFTYIELDKIFRQQDQNFIDILNNLRNDQCTAEDIKALNEHYSPDKQVEDAITVTTHNHLADKMNRDALDKIQKPSKYFEASVDGDFPEHIFPIAESLELKVGAKVMFIKNDTEENRYYNGKLAEVIELDDTDIWVKMDGHDKFQLERHTWKNIRYTIDPKTKDLEEETIGTFTQYPLKLAWAITVHKSQGLTFEKAVIDVGKAFAPGQVYVALSRLRSLDGLTLRTKISDSVISSDSEVIGFSSRYKRDDELPALLKAHQSRFLHQMLTDTFDFTAVPKQIDYIKKKAGDKLDFEDEEMRTALDETKQKFLDEHINTQRFRNQITQLIREENHKLLLTRVKKGSAYYLKFLSAVNLQLLVHIEEVSQLSKTKTYTNLLKELDQLIAKSMEEVLKAEYLSGCIVNNKKIEPQESLKAERDKIRKELVAKAVQHVKDNPKNLSTKTGRKRKGLKKGETYDKTFDLFNSGKNIAEIADERNLAKSTIESHIARGISLGEIDLGDTLKKDEISGIEKGFAKNYGSPIKDVYTKLKGKYSFGKIRMVQASHQRIDD
jgi:hypothetical protein